MTNSRAKGASGERELAKELTRILGAKARRGQQHSGIEGKDVVTDIDGLHIECKRVELLSIHKAMDQSIRDSSSGEVAVICHRKNKTKWLLTVELDSILDLVDVLERFKLNNESENHD